jgi:ABC-type antimicrobial peptide transport system permease subunit
MRLTVTGLAIGLVAMLPATDVLSSMLYGVGTYDVLTVAVVTGVLTLVGGLACFLPARRITKNDPLVSLRYQ